jgi:hypothetical protein
MTRIRSEEYMIGSVDDSLTDHGFTVYEGRGPRAADYWQCNVCQQQAEDPNELEHAEVASGKRCWVGRVADVLHDAWIERARI